MIHQIKDSKKQVQALELLYTFKPLTSSKSDFYTLSQIQGYTLFILSTQASILFCRYKRPTLLAAFLSANMPFNIGKNE